MAERHDEQLYGHSSLDRIYPVIDVVDNLESDLTNRPLSAYQGKVLKGLIDDIEAITTDEINEICV